MKTPVLERFYQRFNTWLTPPRIAFLAILVYVLSLIPIFWVSLYSHPAGDDFSYGHLVHQAVLAGGDLQKVLSAAFETVRSSYFSWQGTFSAIFLFALQPAAFAESAYFLTPFIVIGALSISTFVLMRFVYCRLLGGSQSEAMILSALMLLLSVQMVHDQTQAFYWFNGSVYYTVFYSFSLLFFTCIGTLLLENKKRHAALLILCALLAVLLGGGNYTTALTTSFILFVLCAALFYHKVPGRFKILVILLILLGSFGISIAAPGNAVRASTISTAQPALTAIILSLTNAVSWSLTWLRLPQIVLFAMAAVFFYRLPSCPYLTYRHPVLASILLFGFYASQYTPTLYAMGFIGSGRQINIYYYSFYWWIFFTLYYWIHWFKKYHSTLAEHFSSIPLYSFRAASVLLCVILLTAGLMNSYDPLSSLQSLSSGSALTAVLDGSAQAYDQAYQERLVLLTTPSEICYIPANLPVCFPLPKDPLASSEDGSHYWRNECLAKFYGHKKVLLKEAK